MVVEENRPLLDLPELEYYGARSGEEKAEYSFEKSPIQASHVVPGTKAEFCATKQY